MKFITIFFAILNLKLLEARKEDSSLSIVISETADELYVKHKLKFDIFLLGEPVKNVEKILGKLSTLEATQKVFHIKNVKKKSQSFQQSAIILASDHKTAVDFLSTSQLTNRSPKKLKFLVYVENVEDDLLPSQIAKYILYFTYFIIDRKSEIHLSSVEYFTEEICDKPRMKVINRFMKSSQSWESPLKIEEKFQNFHNCPLIFLFPDLGYHTRIDQETLEPKGLLKDITNAIASKGNFSTVLQILVRGKPSKGLKSHVAIEMKPQASKTLDGKPMHLSSIIEEDPFVFALTRGEEYSSYEKFLLPFDEETWTFLLITFGFSFLAIFIINRLPKIIRNLVYGQNVQHAALNVVATFFGISQLRLPSENFARITLIFFIFFCLVIRTGYQGVYYAMLTSDMRRPRPKTIQEMFERNFTIYTNGGSLDKFIKNLLQLDRTQSSKFKVIKDKSEWIRLFTSHMMNSTPKIAFLFDGRILHIISSRLNISKLTLDETICNNLLGLAFSPNSFIFQLYHESLRFLVDAGIPQWMIKLNFEYSFKPFEELPDEPQVLSMEDLGAGFEIWFLSTLTSVFAFLIEIFVKLILIYGRKFLNVLVGITIVLRYWKIYRV